MLIDDDLSSLLTSFDLVQHVRELTRRFRDGVSGNLLDLVITVSTSSILSAVGVHDIGNISDHRLLVCSASTGFVKPRLTSYKYRDLKNIDIDEFQDNLLNSSLFTDPAANCEDYAKQIDDVTTEILDKLAPIKSKTKPRGAKVNRWLTPEAVAAKRKRRRLERKWLAGGSEQVRVEYRRVCRETNKLMIDSRRKHIADRLDQNSSNPRRLWSTIKQLLHPSVHSGSNDGDENHGFCNKLGEFFHNKIRDIRSVISQRLMNTAPTPMKFDQAHGGQKWSDIQPVTTEEVAKTINSMPGKSSPMDAVPTSLIKKCPDIFSRIICHLANLSFTEGVFPERYKSAQITPLLKKEGLDPSEPVNYRPISNLNTISKILERLFAARLIPHVGKSSSFNPLQSAYRKFHNTETALTKILSDAYSHIDNKKVVVLIALDLSAAFDTLEHGLLLDRLSFAFGVSGSALRWIRSYLNGRKQFVKMGDATSPTTDSTIGVPQGSVLGPALFSLFTAPIAHVINSFGVSYHQYADDTQLYVGVHAGELELSADLLNQCTIALQDWFNNNGLCLNPSKSEVLLVGTRQRLASSSDELNDVTIKIADCPIKPSRQIKNLGFLIDSSLSFDSQVNATCKAAHFHLRALKHIRNTMSVETAKTIACSMINSRLDYCNSLLLGCSAKNISKLQTVQNSAARVVLNFRKYEHITPALKALHWLPVSGRINFKAASIVFKTRFYHQPDYLNSMLIDYVPPRQLRSSSQNLLLVPRSNTVIGARAFSVAGPRIWNSLPENIKSARDILDFNRKLKTHLFRKTYCT